MHGDPTFLLQLLNALYMADICAKFEKNLDSTSFSSDLCTLRVFTTRFSKVYLQFGSEKKLLTQLNIEKYYSFQGTKIIRTFLKKTKTSQLSKLIKARNTLCNTSRRQITPCTREFWLKSLSPKQNFVAGRSHKQSNQNEICDPLGR